MNDVTPQSFYEIDQFVPAVFSGYGGLVALSGWTGAVQLGAQAVTTGPEQVWAHDGGPLVCYVFGIYVVRPDGGLAFSERFVDGPVAMYGAGQFIRYLPLVALQSIFPSW